MSRIAEIHASIEDYRAAELITGALQDISSIRMQTIRRQFEKNTRFFRGIREVYGVVSAHAREGTHSVSHRERGPQKDKKDLYIGITSNKRFYGTLNRDVTAALLRRISSAQQAEFLIVGQTGAQYLTNTAHAGVAKETVFANDVPSTQELRLTLHTLETYGRIYAIYPRFINPFRQEVAMVDITETPSIAETADMRVEYIFEPDIPSMLTFFDAQVRRVLFERVLLESELARTATRLLKMRDAQESAGEMRGEQERALRREMSAIANMHLLETFVGFKYMRP